ncbi:hypothetical protein AGLY_001557 [Aphis glycines]|uniref:Uncharacterized protein n=1 Tax=Aphis glycines TaxID=307491 RepID=A0A6G0U5I6_APHGL|nr:hypothetical protein AGLY_001557 [Aphis glycines]
MVDEKGGLCFNGLNTPKFKFFYNYCKLNLWKILENRYGYAISKICEKLSIEFFNLKYKHKNVVIFQLQNYLKIFLSTTATQALEKSFDSLMSTKVFGSTCISQARIKTFRGPGVNTWLWAPIDENNSLKLENRNRLETRLYLLLKVQIINQCNFKLRRLWALYTRWPRRRPGCLLNPGLVDNPPVVDCGFHEMCAYKAQISESLDEVVFAYSHNSAIRQ